MQLHASAPAQVLVVDDEPDLRTLYEMTLLREGHRVDCAGNLLQARALLAAGRYDLLITDMRLPDGSGLGVIRSCRRLMPQADILVITMSSEDEQILACIEAGASGYVLKEAGHTQILKAILDLRAGGSPISPVIARKVLARMRDHTAQTPDTDEAEASLLTRREADILELISRGGTYAKVAQALGLSVGTVQTHIKHIYAKLCVHSRAEAVIEAQRRGLIPIELSPSYRVRQD